MTFIKKYILFFVVLISCQSKLQVKDVIIEHRLHDFNTGTLIYRYNLSDNSIIWFNIVFKEGIDSIIMYNSESESESKELFNKYRTYENNDTIYNYLEDKTIMVFKHALSGIDFRSASSDTLIRDNYLCIMDHSFDVAIVKITFYNHKDLIIHTPLQCNRGFNKDDKDYKVLQPFDKYLSIINMEIYSKLKKLGLQSKYDFPFIL